MRARFLFFSSLLLILINSHSSEIAAQDAVVSYQLRQPTTEEYLLAIPNIIAQFENEQNRTLHTHNELVRVIEWEIKQNNPSLFNVDVELIYDAYQSLLVFNGGYIDREYWNQQIITAWLNQNSAALHDLQTLHFYDYVLDVSERDFNADGQTEWLVLAKHDGFYEQYLVFRAGEFHQYELVDTPLPWFGCCYMSVNTQNGNIEELSFEDINGDDLPEWILSYRGGTDGVTWAGGLYILAWQNNELVSMVTRGESNSLLYITAGQVTTEISNIDDDSLLEVQQIETVQDNWNCTFVDTTVVDWLPEEGRFQIIDLDREFEDSWGCNLRSAQIHMWDHDYQAAILFFEESLEMASDQATESSRVQYAQMRLALAHAFVGNVDESQAILTDLLSQTPETVLMGSWMTRLSTLSHVNGLSLCQVIYNVATYANPYRTEIVALGGSYDRPTKTGGTGGFDTPNPIYAGCDFPFELDRVLSGNLFLTSQPILEQISVLGIMPDTVVSFDLNADQSLEWLIWTEPLVDPIFFVPDGDFYHISRPNVQKPSSTTTVGTIELPEDTGFAIVNKYYEQFSLDGIGITAAAYQYPAWLRCLHPPNIESPFNTETGFLRVWRLAGYELLTILDMPTCEDRAVEEYFPFGRVPTQFEGWVSATPENDNASIIVPTTYVWDQESLVFQPNPVELVTFDSPHQPVQQAPTVHSYEILDLDTEDAAAVDALSSKMAVALPYFVDQKSINEVANARLWYAQLLIIQANTDEALSQYVHIVNDLPDTSWTMWASLHVEEIENYSELS